ncbi:DUF3298 and DUF4163 domain-containing protein [uncultured Mailhella sp.]|uniref:DUF3298 and DUF4163 domain-containing protein n=1 Tax=uncultured Mailhella sp. TaxID=1981031 RepID=UPI0025F57C8C|nr:DUF3298 and DUF4163 domain-containing protein [uncultured Mailhella sp.]
MKLLSLIVSLAVTLGAHAACAAQSAVSTYTEEAPSVSIRATWQRFGLTRPDNASDDTVRNAVAAFRSMAAEEREQMRSLRADDPDMPEHTYEMDLEGVISGNDKVAGILWKDYQYLGGAHGSLTLSSRNYTRSDGREVRLQDLFRRPDKALTLFSELSRKKLAQRDLPQDMVEAGTAPDQENFQVFLLEKDGITLYFSPYQVGPWSEGVVTVTLSLRELAAAEPHTAYWK